MNSLVRQYQQQSNWRDWTTAMGPLPQGRGGTVLDLGCAVGEQTSLLASLSFRVIGVDSNEALLEAARGRGIANATFLQGDLSRLDGLSLPKVDGIWASFVPAYFPDFQKVLEHWISFLKPGGWIALVEMSHLLDHEPLRPETRRLIEEFYDEAFRMGRYDFRMGSKLASYLATAGLMVGKERVLEDKELSFHGVAEPSVLLAWRERFDRMGGLKKFLGNDFETFEREFLGALARPDHRSHCRGYRVIAEIPT